MERKFKNLDLILLVFLRRYTILDKLFIWLNFFILMRKMGIREVKWCFLILLFWFFKVK